MKKRLRKKFRVGEFREFGFEVKIRLDPALDEEAHWEFLDRWDEEFVDPNGLADGGTLGPEWDFFVWKATRGTLTEEHRKLAKAWLRQAPRVAGFDIGPLRDVHYGWE